MWLNQLFSDNPIDFEKKCKTRIKTGIGIIILVILSIGMVFLRKGNLLEENSMEFISHFYPSLGFALIAGGFVKIARNVRYLKNPFLRKKQEVAETDERNRLLGLRCWAYTGYTMFLILYIGILVSGFISMTVLLVLQMVIAIYALLLLFFRFLLNRFM